MLKAMRVSLGLLAMCWCDADVDHSPNQAMVCPTLYSPGDSDLAYILPADNDIVNKMPLTGPWMHPCGLVLVGHPEEGVGGCEIVF